jgi:RecB family exonuclease
MKKLILGDSAALNEYWAGLEKTISPVWLVKSRESRRLIELQKPANGVIDIPGWCRDRLAVAGLVDLKLLDYAQELALLRLVLTDGHQRKSHAFGPALEYPGSQKRLLARLQRLPLSPVLAETTGEFDRSSEVDELRQLYHQYQLQVGVCDEQLIMQRFLDFLDEPALQLAIRHWTDSISELYGQNATISIPCCENFHSLQEDIVLQVFATMENMQAGLTSQRLGANQKFNRALEKWLAVAGIELVPLVKESENSTLDHYRFANAAKERTAVLTIVNFICREHTEKPLAVYTPGDRFELDQLVSGLNRAGRTHIGLQTALIECPEVRTAIDIMEAIRDGWPVNAVADLLRNPELQFSEFDLNLNRRKIDRLASEIASLGEISGLLQIQELLYLLWDEAERFQGRSPKADYQLQAIDLLRQIETATSLPAEHKTWSDWQQWLVALLSKLLGTGFVGRLDSFWQMITEFGEIQLALADTSWQFPEFIAELQLQASQKLVNQNEIAHPDVVLFHPQLPDFSILGEWLNFGMSEGHYPSRQRLREGLRSGKSMATLFETESNSFADLCGMGFNRSIFTSAKMDGSGVEQESSGLLRQIPVSDWNQSGFDKAANPVRPLSDEANRFFTRAVTLYNSRNMADSRYLGRLLGDNALTQLGQIFNDDYGFSPTSLESASLCPFQFFAGQVLKLDETEVSDDLETDYLTEGSVIHAVLEDLHTCLPEISFNNLDRIKNLIPEKIDQHFQASERVKNSVAANSRFQIRRRRIEHRLAGYLEQMAKQIQQDRKEYGHSARVLGVELNTRASNVSIGPLILHDPASGNRIKVHGRIDRIDQLTDGEISKIRIIDYKTGGKIDKNQILRRIHLQLPLYGMMLNRKMIGQAQSEQKLKVEVADLGFWYLKKSIGGYKSIVKNLNGENGSFDMEQIGSEFEGLVIDLVQAIRAGEFNIRPRMGKCEERCPLQDVCRIGEIREHPGMKL